MHLQGYNVKNLSQFLSQTLSQRGASDSIANFSALSNPADSQNVFRLGLCGSIGIFAR